MMMIVYTQLFEKVDNFIANLRFNSFVSCLANVRSILGISNINENTEVKADRYPQYEVQNKFLFSLDV